MLGGSGMLTFSAGQYPPTVGGAPLSGGGTLSLRERSLISPFPGGLLGYASGDV